MVDAGPGQPQTIPVPVNPFADFFVKLDKMLIEKGEDAVKAYLIANPPTAWLEAPVVRLFTNAILDGAAKEAETVTTEVIYTIVNDVQVNAEKSLVVQAVNQMRAAKLKGDADALSEADAKVAAAYAALGHFNGAPSA